MIAFVFLIAFVVLKLIVYSSSVFLLSDLRARCGCGKSADFRAIKSSNFLPVRENRGNVSAAVMKLIYRFLIIYATIFFMLYFALVFALERLMEIVDDRLGRQ